MKEILKGYKTYIAAGIIALTAFYQIYATGAIDNASILALATALGFVGIKSAVSIPKK